MNSLEALNLIITRLNPSPDNVAKAMHEVKIVEKSLTALEIIIKKNVNVYWLKLCLGETNGLDMYNARNNQELTKDEYDLLKEIFDE